MLTRGAEGRSGGAEGRLGVAEGPSGSGGSGEGGSRGGAGEIEEIQQGKEGAGQHGSTTGMVSGTALDAETPCVILAGDGLVGSNFDNCVFSARAACQKLMSCL